MINIELEWKTVVYNDKETNYIISNNGDLINTKTNHLYKRKLSNSGYVMYNLSLGNKIQITMYAHRLVALAFIPNPENKPQVNHIDGNKLNNHISNLEWVTQEENMEHCMNSGLSSLSKPINRYDTDGNYIDSFPSASEASRQLGYKNSRSISCCLLGEYKVAHGFQWRFSDDNRPVEKLFENEYFSKKSVVQLTLDGEYVKTFDIATNAYKELGKKDNGMISQCCKGKRGKYSGYRWLYLEDYLRLKETI